MASCNCLRGSGAFRFTFEPLDCKNFVYEDFSDWMEDDHYVVPEEYTVMVSLPGQKHPATISVRTGVKNKITSKNLQGREGLCLPDGVYCFTFDSCGKKYQRHVGIACRLQCCLDQAVAKLTTDDDWEVVSEIRNWIDSFHANADQGKLKHAQKAYVVADKLLKQLNCPCNNCC